MGDSCEAAAGLLPLITMCVVFGVLGWGYRRFWMEERAHQEYMRKIRDETYELLRDNSEFFREPRPSTKDDNQE